MTTFVEIAVTTYHTSQDGEITVTPRITILTTADKLPDVKLAAMAEAADKVVVEMPDDIIEGGLRPMTKEEVDEERQGLPSDEESICVYDSRDDDEG